MARRTGEGSAGRPRGPRTLQVLKDKTGPDALSALWPDVVRDLPPADRAAKVRVSPGAETVFLDEQGPGGRTTRGFVRAVLRVPLGHPAAQTYGVFVEVDRQNYGVLQQAFRTETTARATGRLANRLPYLEDAFDSVVVVEESGGTARARIVEADSELLRQGPAVGPSVRPDPSTGP